MKYLPFLYDEGVVEAVLLFHLQKALQTCYVDGHAWKLKCDKFWQFHWCTIEKVILNLNTIYAKKHNETLSGFFRRNQSRDNRY